MTAKPINSVIVVDDNPRFPYSVWRALSLAAEFGYEEKERSYVRFAPAAPEHPERIALSPDGVFVLEWIDSLAKFPPPSTTFRERLLHWRAQGATLWAILDVRHRSQTSLTEFRDSFRSCGGIDKHLVFMTSYRTHHHNLEIMPKEIESLRVLRKQIYDERPASQAVEWNTKAAHVLITGAGFEIRDDETGIGLPLTKQILLETQLLPSGTRKRSRHERFIEWNMEESGYPWPTLGIVGGKDRVRLETAARAKNLDVYWDVLLSAVHSLYEVTVDETLTSREQAKADAANLEFRLREGFRRSIVKYDMGQMAQSLAAARISWKAWLTTNYTNFIDRAIEVSAHNRSLWRLLQTPIEAEVFLSEQLARGDLDAGLAVKLHGDIAHAHTMALAGHDKEVISPLFVRPTLSVMYAAATEALCACLTRSKNELPKECWWHVVGHGLEDRPLLALIRNVTERTGGVKHSFRVVSLDPERVITSLRHALDPNTSCDIQAEQMTAVQYMSQLRDGSFRASPNSSIPPPPAPNDGLGFGTEGHTVPDERWPDDRPRA